MNNLLDLDEWLFQEVLIIFSGYLAEPIEWDSSNMLHWSVTDASKAFFSSICKRR
jgi:hypothetical protein